MNPLAKKLILVLYLAISGAVFVNYLIGLRWFGPYDKLAMWGWVAFSVLGGNWLTSRAEEKVNVVKSWWKLWTPKVLYIPTPKRTVSYGKWLWPLSEHPY